MQTGSRPISGQDRAAVVRCSQGHILLTLEPGERLDTQGELRSHTCACGEKVNVRVIRVR